MNLWTTGTLLFLFFFANVVSAYTYTIQNTPLNSKQMRIVFGVTDNLKRNSFSAVNRSPDTVLPGLWVHQMYTSLTDKKTVALVFVDNPDQIQYPDKMNLENALLFHFPFYRSTLALWVQGLSPAETASVIAVVKKQIVAEMPTLWNQILPSAYAERCLSTGAAKPPTELTEKLGESSFSQCWDKLGEGVQAYGQSVQKDVEKKLNFDLAEHWHQFKQTVSGIATFAQEFLQDPAAWTKKNIPNSESLDLSGLAEIRNDQLLGLACLTLGRDGASTLVNSLVRGPTGLGIKVFEMLKKVSMISKLFGILKTLGQVSAEKVGVLKDKIVALAEKLIKKQESDDKVDSIAGLMKLSPAMAQEGFACMGL